MNQRTKIYLAIAIALAGLLLAISSYWRGRTLNVTAAVPKHLSEVFDALLGDTVIDTYPTEDTVEDVAGEIGSIFRVRLLELQGGSRLSVARRDDLQLAVTERFRAVLDPDFDRDFRSLARRGDPRKKEEARISYEERREWYEAQRFSPLGLDGVRAQLWKRGGRSIGSTLRAEGLSSTTTTRTKGRMPVPTNPIDRGWDVVEVVLPMQRALIQGEGRGMVLLGYRFAWSVERKQWIPYATEMYRDPNDSGVYPALPFF